MKRNFEKNIHVLNQLMGYCKRIGGSEIHSKFIIEGEKTHITVSVIKSDIDSHDIDELRKQLAISRQPEVEEDYWNLGLSGNMGDEMSLVGMMTDTTEVMYEDDTLTIIVERHDD
ncbi:MAG: hypothetical protein FWH05_05720 [Oscillospiraceae bacterium]|nr:hypothetical protein [Oscillospiraceae bacterium]